jgi:hypothetical protein
VRLITEAISIAGKQWLSTGVPLWLSIFEGQVLPLNISWCFTQQTDGLGGTMRKLLIILAGVLPVGFLVAELGSNNPTDDQVNTLRMQEGGSGGSGVFDIPAPPDGTTFHPVKRVAREQFGVVGPFPLQLEDLDALTYPDATDDERQAMLEGMTFFTTAHTPAEGAGPMANQPFCLGCHMSSADAIPGAGIVNPDSCIPGSTCVSIVSRAARSTPTNFKVTSYDPVTGGGVAPGKVLPAPDGRPDPADNLDAVNGPGRTAAFTTFGDFNPSHADAASNPTGIGFFDPLDGAAMNLVTGKTAQPFGGFVQHHRPSIADCVPKPLPPVQFDTNLQGTPDPVTGLDSATGFRRSVGERAGPPYIGRGLMEAIPTADLTAMADPTDTGGTNSTNSSLGNFAAQLGCTGDCIAGKANTIPRNFAVHMDSSGNVTSVTGFVGGMGRFGLRANGVEILQFIIGGAQGELSLTTKINNTEINFPTLFPQTLGGVTPTQEPAACSAAASAPVFPAATAGKTQELFLSEPISERNFIRNIAPPEFGNALLRVLETANPARPLGGELGRVQRGAELFGIDLVAFANRMVQGKMPASGDGRDPHAINQADRMVGCVACHIPVQRTGQSPANVGAGHLSFVWAPVFSDLLLHKMPAINAERISPLPRYPLVFPRAYSQSRHRGKESIFTTFDLPRNLADDTFSNQKASADGREFRTPPLMGMGRMGPPFLHDARVYLSSLTVDLTPASTVTTNSEATNAPLVIRTLDDAILAAIELHDLPAPDDAYTSELYGGGCPVPPVSSNINYGSSPADAICPAYNSTGSQTNRSDAREVILRFRSLSTTDQKALIEFLKQL